MCMGLALLLALAEPAGSIAGLGWLAGAWSETKSNGEWTEEYWTPPRGDLMIGAGLAGRGDTVRHFEHMRIFKGADGVVTFVGMPNGGKPARFTMVRQTEDEIIFENSAHDYPQRVSYRREGASIVASVSLIDGSKENRWVYTRL